jgi:hypothetical protein
MHNKTILKICFVVAAILAAGSAYAAGITGSTTIGTGSTFSPSNSVRINAVATSAAYAANSSHLNGNRYYFTNNSDPKFYYATRAAGTAYTTDPTSATVAADTSTMTSL